MLYLQVLKDGTIGHSGKTLNYHRRHAQSVVAKNLQSASNTIPDYFLIHEYVLSNYDIDQGVFDKMVEYVSKELRQLFPNLTDSEFMDLYNPKELHKTYEKKHLYKQ
jgi:hypothetical protein